MFVKLFVLACLIFLSSQSLIQTVDSASTSTPTQSPEIAILPYNPDRHWMLPKGKPAALSTSDLEIIEASLDQCIQRYNAGIERQAHRSLLRKTSLKDLVIDLSQYKRQYVVVELDNGHREVWINCFCDPLGIDWTKVTVEVDDGGKCFFNLMVRLPDGKCHDLEVNGEA